MTVKINLIPEKTRKHENMLANAFLTFKDDNGGYFTIPAFTVWKSKEYKGLNVTEPQKTGFKYVQFESNYGRMIKAEIVRCYEKELIPVID